MIKFALHDFLKLQLNCLDSAHVRGTIILCETVDIQLAFMDMGDIVVFEIKNFLRVLNDRRGIRRKEKLCWLGDAIILKKRTRLRPVQKGFIRWSQKPGSGLLDSYVLRSLLSGKRSIFRILHVDEVHLHLL